MINFIVSGLFIVRKYENILFLLSCDNINNIVPFYVLLGDMAASQVVGLTEEITAIVMYAKPERGDKVRNLYCNNGETHVWVRC